MRIPAVSRRSRSSIEIAMTPMIDVVFLLLVFFLATASFERVERAMPTGVSPQEAAAEGGQTGSLTEWLDQMAADEEEIVVRILQASPQAPVSYSINGTAVAGLDELQTRLSALARARSDLPLIVSPDADVPMGAAMQVYDTAVGAGSASVFFAAQ